MNVPSLNIPQQDAAAALRSYKEHRACYDARDWEIERIYRAIAKGKTVISVIAALRSAGLDEQGRPRLAFGEAANPECYCCVDTNKITFSRSRRYERGHVFSVEWPGAMYKPGNYLLRAQTPRIPPQHRPDQKHLSEYHLLWEADWTEIPRDPYLLKRIGKDAWIVLAAWDLTEVEVSVLRAHAKPVS
jgi:hypothetical protein